MNPLHYYRRHLRLLVLMAIAAYAVAVATAGILVVFGIAAIASGYITDGPRGRFLPKWAANLLVLAAVAWIAIDWIDNPDPGRTMLLIGQMVLWLAVVKLYEDRKPKDDRQIVVLSVIAVMVGCLYSFQLLFGILVLVFAGQAVLFSMLHRLHAGQFRLQNARRVTEAAGPVPPVELSAGRHPLAQFRALAIGSAAVAMLVASGVFMIFPRDAIGSNRLRGAQTGFTPEVNLTENDRIIESNREVFTVTWLDPAGVAQEWPQPLLLRGAVLDKYEPATRRWTDATSRSRGRTLTTPNPEQYVPLGSSAAEYERGTYTQIVTMRSLATEAVFAAWAPVAILCEQQRSFTLDPASLVMEDTSPDRLDRYWTYRLLVQPFPSVTTIESIVGDSNPPQRVVGFPVPGVRKETVRVLQKMAPELLEPVASGDSESKWRRNREIAEVLSSYLQGEDFRYTLDLRDFVQSRNADPILQFLTEYRFGHCEYFASALAGMCRSVGVEARVVTGFVAIEYDGTLDHYVVRESNAHAWVEVRTGLWQWRPFDPTRTDTLTALQAERRSWADNWRWLYDRADFLWNSRFVTFDGATQATLAARFTDSAGSRLKDVGAWLSSAAQRVNRFFQLGPAGYIWLGIVGVVVVIAIVALVITLKRRRRLMRVLRFEGILGAKQIFGARFYVDILDAFERIGTPKPVSVPPMTHLAVVRHARPDIASAVEPLLHLFYEVRFGSRILDRSERRQAEEAARTVLADSMAHSESDA